MVLIAKLKNKTPNLYISCAEYIEGPDHFDEWYALVQEKCPNATIISCENNQLTTIDCPNATEINCADNKLTTLNCPNAVKIYCGYNQLTTLDCPNVINIDCWHNQLTTLNCPNATIIHCGNNQINTLNAPSATEIYCQYNCLEYIYAPIVQQLTYDVTFEGQNIVIKVPDSAELLNKNNKLVSYWNVCPSPQVKSARTYGLTKS